MMDAVKQYQVAEKRIAAFKMELSKSQKEVLLISESRKELLWSCWYQALSFTPSSTG